MKTSVTGKHSSPAFWLGAILAGSWLLKFPAFFHPLLGYFSSYQVINAMMAEKMITDFPAGVLIPQTRVLMAGGPAIHLIYYPFGALGAALFKFFLPGSIDFWGRFQAGLCMLLAAFFLYNIARKFFSRPISLLGTFVFSFSPMILLSGIMLQNEAPAMLFLLASVWLFMEKRSPWAGLASGVLFSLCLAARLHFLFVLPVYFVMGLTGRYPWRCPIFWVLGALIPVTAFFAWTYQLSLQYPDRMMSTLFMQAGEGRLLVNPLFGDPAFYFRIFKTLAGQWLTPIFLLFFIAGFFSGIRKYPALSVWLVGSFAAIILLPQKVFDHPFYLISGLAPAALLAADFFYDFLARFKARRLLLALSVILYLVFSLRLFLVPAFSEDGAGRIPEIGQKVQALTEPGTRVIAEHDTNPDLLYYCGRMGWSFDLDMARHPLSDQPRHRRLKEQGYGDPVRWFRKLQKDGADYLVISQPEKFYGSKEFSGMIEKEFQRANPGDDFFLVFDLRRRKS